MKSTTNKARTKNEKLKTLCTLDTSDILLTNQKKQSLDRTRNYSKLSNQRRQSKVRQQTEPQLYQTIVQKNHIPHNNSIKWQNTVLRNKTINTDKKPRKSMGKSRQRMKTEYQETSPKKMTLQNLQIFTTVKNVKFRMDEQYNVDPFQVIKVIKATNQETVSVVKYLDSSKKSNHFIMKKSNSPKMIQKYEEEIRIKQKLTDLFKSNERKNFSCIHKVYRKDKNDNMYVVYDMQGQSLSWKKPLSKKLIQNLPKNNMQILKHLIVQMSKSIHILSSYNYYHSEIRLKNILLELKEDDQNVKVSKTVKLGNLRKCYKIDDKKSFVSMGSSIYTPPQILNFIMFENRNKNFNRSWLDYIYGYKDGWRIMVWSLGVLVLELINQEPLDFDSQYMVENSYDSNLKRIVQFQQNIQVKCSYLLGKINDDKFLKILKKMLSINPQQRPSPQQIIVALTA